MEFKGALTGLNDGAAALKEQRKWSGYYDHTAENRNTSRAASNGVEWGKYGEFKECRMEAVPIPPRAGTMFIRERDGSWSLVNTE